MLNAISESTASNALASTQSTAIQWGSKPSPSATSSAIADSVKLSATAEAHAMHQRGMAVKAIAANMGVSTQIVNSYLGASSVISGGGGSGASEALKNIAAHVRVNPPADGSK